MWKIYTAKFQQSNLSGKELYMEKDEKIPDLRVHLYKRCRKPQALNRDLQTFRSLRDNSAVVESEAPNTMLPFALVALDLDKS